MAGTSVKMKKNKTQELREIVKAVRRGLTVDNDSMVTPEVLCEHWRETGDAKACLLAFERYYFRNGSYASLSMMFLEANGVQTVDCVGSGGGEGLLNFSWGANRNFARMGYDELVKLGFEEDKEGLATING